MFISEAMPHHPLTQIEIVHRLKKVGFTQEQAETHAQIVTEVNESSLATKKDFQDFEKTTDAEFISLQKEMKSEFTLVRKEIELTKFELKRDMEALKFDLTIRMILVITSALTILTALQKFVL